MQTKIVDLDKDLDELMSVAQKAFSSTPDASLDEWFSFSEMVEAIGQNRGICVKALSDDGKIIGMVYAQQESPANGKEGLEKWVIVITAVDPAFTGTGVGSSLLSEIEQQAIRKGAKKMFVYTNKGDSDVIEFYRRNGYEDAGWVRDYQYGKDNSAVFLLKYL